MKTLREVAIGSTCKEKKLHGEGAVKCRSQLSLNYAVFRRLGLSGKNYIPIIIGTGCMYYKLFLSTYIFINPKQGLIIFL